MLQWMGSTPCSQGGREKLGGPYPRDEAAHWEWDAHPEWLGGVDAAAWQMTGGLDAR